MLTREEFFKRKIFLKESIKKISTLFSNNGMEITEWYQCDEYKSVQKKKTFLRTKIKGAAELDSTHVVVTNELLYALFNWWKNTPKVCHYCGLPQEFLLQLNSQKNHINKRWPKRGQSLEIDRKLPDKAYSVVENLVLACYWCNNAKTDTFAYQEFRKVGEAFNAIWSRRLSQKFEIPN